MHSSRGSSQPRFFTTRTTWEAQCLEHLIQIASSNPHSDLARTQSSQQPYEVY